ncbi:MAG: response regulator [Pirellulaceae bacterium]
MNHRVLLAGCDAATRETCQSCLEVNGYEVTLASDGVDCWTKLSDRMPVAAVLGGDLRWGGADGVISRLREEGGEKTVPVIFIGHEDDLEAMRDALAEPIVACLPTPVRASTLLECLKRVERRAAT